MSNSIFITLRAWNVLATVVPSPQKLHWTREDCAYFLPLFERAIEEQRGRVYMYQSDKHEVDENDDGEDDIPPLRDFVQDEILSWFLTTRDNINCCITNERSLCHRLVDV